MDVDAKTDSRHPLTQLILKLSSQPTMSFGSHLGVTDDSNRMCMNIYVLLGLVGATVA